MNGKFVRIWIVYILRKRLFFTVVSMYLNSKWPQWYFCGWVNPIKRCSSALLTGNTLKLMSLYQTLFESGFLDHAHLYLWYNFVMEKYVSIQSFFWNVWRMSPKSRKSDKNFWTYLCSTSKSNFRFAIGSDRILTSIWFRAHKSNIDLVMENTLFIIGNLADMCSGKVVWKYETIFDTHLMWQVATCMYLNSLHQNLDK